MLMMVFSLLLFSEKNKVISMLWIIFLLSLTNSSISIWHEMNSFSMTMVSLSILVSTLMLMTSKAAQSRIIIFLLCILISFFMTNNLIFLYIFFELSLIPTLFLILKWGYQPERLQAGYYLMMYTITASLPLLWMVTQVYSKTYSLSLTPSFLSILPPYFNSFLSLGAFSIAFLVKLPTFGAHLWLPKAHVEAPVSGSMILAGLLLKLGGYGLMKIIYMLKLWNSNFMLLMISSSLWGACIISLVCINSLDIKKLIAYSSVVHMNLLILGIMSKSNLGNKGAILMMISHGISSPGMFALANMNYMKTKSRNILFHKNIAQLQSPLTLGWFLLISANMAAPPSLNLASEILIVYSMLKISTLMAMLLAFITFMSAGYNLYLFSSLQGKNNFPPHQKNHSNDYLMMVIQSKLCYLLILVLPLWF